MQRTQTLLLSAIGLMRRNMLVAVLTLYRARLSRQGLCLTTLFVPDAVFVVVLVALFKPRFFSEPIEPFSRSGFSTSGPPNSCSCCNQQHSIASIPSSTCTKIPKRPIKSFYTGHSIEVACDMHSQNTKKKKRPDPDTNRTSHADNSKLKRRKTK